MTALEATDVQDTFGQDTTPDDLLKRFINGRNYFWQKLFQHSFLQWTEWCGRTYKSSSAVTLRLYESNRIHKEKILNRASELVNKVQF